MPSVKSTETYIHDAIRDLGDQATTKNIADRIGFTQSTVIKWALRLGYTKPFHGQPWRSPEPPTPAAQVNFNTDELTEAINRIAEAIESNARVDQPKAESSKPNHVEIGLAKFDSSDETLMRQASPRSDLETRLKAVQIYASYMLADQLQN